MEKRNGLKRKEDYSRLDELWVKVMGNGKKGLVDRVTVIEVYVKITMGGVGALLLLMIKQIFFTSVS